MIVTATAREGERVVVVRGFLDAEGDLSRGLPASRPRFPFPSDCLEAQNRWSDESGGLAVYVSLVRRVQ